MGVAKGGEHDLFMAGIRALYSDSRARGMGVEANSPHMTAVATLRSESAQQIEVRGRSGPVSGRVVLRRFHGEPAVGQQGAFTLSQAPLRPAPGAVLMGRRGSQSLRGNSGGVCLQQNGFEKSHQTQIPRRRLPCLRSALFTTHA